MEAAFGGKDRDASCGVSAARQAEHTSLVVIRILDLSDKRSEIEKGEVHGDPEIPHVLLEGGGHVGAELVFLIRVECELHQVSIAIAKLLVGSHLETRLGKEGTGPVGIVGVLRYVRVVPFFIRWGFRSPEGLATSKEDSTDETFPIDAMGNGLAEAAVGEPGQFVRRNEGFARRILPGILIQPDETGVGGWPAVVDGKSIAGGIPPDPSHIVGREAFGIRLAGGKGEGAGIGVFDEFCDEEVDIWKANSLGISPPVMRVGLKDNAFSGLVGAEAEGTGPYKPVGLLLGHADIPGFEEGAVPKGGFELVFRKDADSTDVFEERGKDLRAGQADGEIVHFLDLELLSVDGEVKGRAVGKTGIVDGLKREDHVIGGKGLSIGPTDTRTDMEGEGAVVGSDLPAGGKPGFDFLGDGVVSYERIEKEADESSRGGIFRN